MAALGEDERRSDATTKIHHGPTSPLQKIEEKLSSKKNSPEVEGDEQEEDTKYGSSTESLDMLPSARFNILDRMQIPRISPSYLTQPHPQSILSQINSAYSRQTATHFSLDALRGISHVNREEPNNGLYSKKSRKGKNNKEGKKRSKDSKKSERFEEEEASPLDFSTKRTKLQNVEVASRGFENNGKSGGNQLRSRLSMKSPSICEDLGSNGNAAALNLSKESPKSSQWCKSESASCSSSSSSPLLPSMEVPQTFVTSPKPANNPVTLTSPPIGGHSLFSTMNGPAALGNGAAGGINGTAYPLSFSPWANGVFSPCVSPVMNQPAFPSGTGMPLETNPSIFSHQIPTSSSSAIGFNPSAAFPFMSNMQGSKSLASGKPPPRPFKAYPNPNPKDLQSIYNNFGGLPIGPSGSTEALIHQQSQQAYVKFREQMIASSHQTRTRRGGQRSDSGHGGSSECGDDAAFAGPSHGNSSGDASMDDSLNPECQVGKNGQVKDRVYWERRKKNNEAAKRSRDARRAKEDEIAIRAAFLEQENLKLRFEASVLRQEITRLRHVLYTG